MEKKIHLRIQTYSVPAVLVLQEALKDLRNENNRVKEMIKVIFINAVIRRLELKTLVKFCLNFNKNIFNAKCLC